LKAFTKKKKIDELEKLLKRKLFRVWKMEEEECLALQNLVNRVMENIFKQSKDHRRRAVKDDVVLKRHVKGHTVHKHRHLKSLSFRALKYAKQVAYNIIKARSEKERKTTGNVNKWKKGLIFIFVNLIFVP
jgi:hypothetical protein